MATVEKDVRQRILDAALKILRKEGVTALTQTHVAATAGLRQSHLTYYFPRKTDLLAATLEASHAQAHKPKRSSTGNEADPVEAVRALMFDRNKMRFFLSVVAQASDQADIRATLAAHAAGVAEQLAPLFGRTADDPDIIAFVDMLRGMGLRLLLETDDKRRASVDLDALAARFGLSRAPQARL
ncbi:TetR family transcriptional regulator [Methylocystis sp.]|jgi:AcrR family transcriptional regulator|uniref:TetR family transcriptional regulator n=1 Tax=Methylocystis sp. TaxID=1911079 RepID=UPI003D0DD94A